MITVLRWTEDTAPLRPIAVQWLNECAKGWLDLSVTVEHHLNDLARMVNSEQADLLVLFWDYKPVGYMGITLMQSPLSDQRIANEHYWYVGPECRGRGSLKLIQAATAWAQSKACSHLIMNASRLAGDLHDRTCRLYVRLGFEQFETSYIKRV